MLGKNQRQFDTILRLDHLTKAETAKLERLSADWLSATQMLRKNLLWKREEGELPANMGRYRISIPIFHLSGGMCKAFFRIESSTPPIIIRRIETSDGILLPFIPITSLHGLRVTCTTDEEGAHNPFTEENFSLIELNWETTKAGTVSVDRNSFKPSATALESLKWLASRSEELEAQALANGPSLYASVNATLNSLVPAPENPWWFTSRTSETIAWNRVNLPAVEARLFSGLSEYGTEVTWNNRQVSIVYEALLWAPKAITEARWRTFVPDKLALITTGHLDHRLVPLHTKFVQRKETHKYRSVAEFPPQWSSLCGFSTNAFGYPPLWNQNHWLIRAVKDEDWEFTATYRRHLPNKADLIASPSRAASFLLYAFKHWASLDRTIALVEDLEVGLFQELLKKASGAKRGRAAQEVGFWIQAPDLNGYLLLMRASGVERVFADDPRIQTLLPDPGSEWTLTVTRQR